jgi:hypothetical protein
MSATPIKPPRKNVWMTRLAVGLAAVAATIALGPRNSFGPNQPTPRPTPPAQLSELDAWLAAQESAIPGVRPDAAKGIVWATAEKKRTPVAVVYLHGFSATRQETAPMARMGIRFQLEEGRLEESSANQGLHASCHDKRFYEALASDGLDVEIAPMDGSLRDIGSWEELIRLFRMPLLDPLSHAPCDTERLDAFIAADLDSRFPGLAYPATIPSRDDLIVLRKSPT